MACNLLNAYKDKTSCKITMAGTGDRAYFFDKDAWLAAIEDEVEAGNITTKGLPSPGYEGFYGIVSATSYDSDTIKKLALLSGLLWGVDIKTDSGQVTSEKSAENEASSQVGTFVVADNIEAFNEMAHTLAFIDFGCIIPKVGGGFYMLMSPYKKTTIENNYDSGTTYDSDHGFTVTLNASPSEYGVAFLPDGKIGGGVGINISKSDDDEGAVLSVSGFTGNLPEGGGSSQTVRHQLTVQCDTSVGIDVTNDAGEVIARDSESTLAATVDHDTYVNIKFTFANGESIVGISCNGTSIASSQTSLNTYRIKITEDSSVIGRTE